MPKTLNELDEGKVWTSSWSDYKDEIKEELMKWYHRSDGNKHQFIREFLDITEEEIREVKKDGTK